MKQILNYLRAYKEEHFHLGEFIFAMCFMVGFAFFNYGTTILKDYKQIHTWEGSYSIFIFILYATPLLLGYLSSSFFTKDWSYWQSAKFWGLILFALLAFTLRACSHLILEPFYEAMQQFEHPRWLWSVIGTILRSSLLLIPIALYWFFVDRKKQNLYGFSLKGYSTRPYFVMLLIMLPLIILASTQGDFLGAYPRGVKFDSLSIQNGAHWIYYGIYELFYGLDFISVEFFFRGFLILAFVGILGPKSILPMAMFYVTIHWGKPAGELISSFFGGTLLGIIAYYSKSILGGIIVHMGIAWMMEIGALIGNYFKT